ncbi:DNA primase, partial [Streptococcus suis]
NVYGAGKETIRHLQQLTPNRYSLRKKRVPPEDYEKLEAWDNDKIKMKSPQHSITKEE